MPEQNDRSPGFAAIPRPDRLAEIAYGRILDIIIARKLAVGDKLPSEAVLADMFAVSRPIIREALMRLRLDGLIQARQGSGSFLSRPPPSRLMARMQPSNISAGLAAYEVRLALETASARLAAENRTPQNLEQIERRLSRLEKKLNAGRDAFEEDLLLHRSIAEATGNPLFASTFDFVTQGVHETMTAILAMTREDGDRHNTAIAREHRAIVKAIAARDAEGAAAAMEQHLRAARRRAVDGYEPGT